MVHIEMLNGFSLRRGDVCMDGAQSVCREVMQKAEQKMGGGQNGDSCCHRNGNSDQSNGESQSSGDSSDSDSQSDS